MFSEPELLQWIFKHDDEVLFIVFTMRIAMCEQSAEVKRHILVQGLKVIRQLIDQKIKHWQSKKKIPQITPEFYLTVEKALRRTMGYSYSSEAIANLLKTLIELHIKDGNPKGIQQYLSKISKTVSSLLPEKDVKARQKFQKFWYPIFWYDWHFIPQYYRQKLKESPVMRAWTNAIFFTIVGLVVATLLGNVNFVNGFSAILGAVFIHYLGRTFWRFSSVIQSKLQLSYRAEQENQQLILELVGLRPIKYVSKPKAKIINGQSEEITSRLDLVPNWHDEVNYEKQMSVSRFSKREETRNTSSKTPITTPALTKAIDSLIIQWKELNPPVVYNSVNPKNEIYPLYSNYLSYNSLFCRLHPGLNKTMTSMEFNHFKKVVERGKIISRKSKGIQGIKPTFRQYKAVNGEMVYSDFKLKIPGYNGRVYGHIVSTTQQEDKSFSLVDFDGYDPKAHENAKRK